MRISTALFSCALTAAALSSSAHAAACVQMDFNRDNLSYQERVAGQTLLTQALAEAGVEVVPQGCGETYSYFHVRMGQSVTLSLSGPPGERTLTVPSIEALPEGYRTLVAALHEPAAAEPAATPSRRRRANADAPTPVEADGGFEPGGFGYLRMGMGSIRASEVAFGPALGAGYRFEFDRVGLDLSLGNFVLAQKRDAGAPTSGAMSASWLRAEGLYFFDAAADRSAYVGGALGWGITAAVSEAGTASGSGAHPEITAGYELLRDSSLRVFGQCNVVLPAYRVHDGLGDPRYTPSVLFTLGAGYSPRIRTVTVIEG